MNKHIEKMHNTLINYRKAVLKAQAKIAENTDLYQPQAAERENKRIREQMERDRQNAESMIKEAQREGHEAVKAWARLDGAQIPADAELLKYDLTPDQFNDLAARYKDNGTMTHLMLQYAEKANAARGIGGALYDVSQLYDEQARRAAYDSFASGALDIIDRINQPDGIGTGANSGLLEISVENFGLPGAQLSPGLSVLDE